MNFARIRNKVGVAGRVRGMCRGGTRVRIGWGSGYVLRIGVG